MYLYYITARFDYKNEPESLIILLMIFAVYSGFIVM